MKVEIGTQVMTVKPTRHGIVPVGVVGEVVEVFTHHVDMEGPAFRVKFPGQSMTFLFPNDKKIGTKLQLRIG